MKPNYFLIWTVFALSAMGCSNHSTEDLSDGEFTGNVTYTGNIKPIIDANCIACHNQPPVNGAPMPLTNYEQVKSAILTRPLLDKISRPQGAPGMMPLGGTRLPQSSINLIALWKAQGLHQ